MDNTLYKFAYALALESRRHKPGLTKNAAGVFSTIRDSADVLFNGGKNILTLQVLPTLAIAAALGVGGGYALNRLSRHSDPAIADSNTVSDINRVERLKKIKYYNSLVKQLESERLLKNTEPDNG